MTPVMMFQKDTITEVRLASGTITFTCAKDRRRILLHFEDDVSRDDAWKLLQQGMSRGYSNIRMSGADVTVEQDPFPEKGGNRR